MVRAIKDLKTDRERLAKYDELTEWKKKFEENQVCIPQIRSDYWGEYVCAPQQLPGYIKKVIISAFDAEIKKLDEE